MIEDIVLTLILLSGAGMALILYRKRTRPYERHIVSHKNGREFRGLADQSYKEY